ncbi:c-type cytochrome [Thiohalorhabdus denitrificans]|uniref:Cytochrome c n=1 Tax=Thiohalorhabdus denitrificans TaxID=381306 RepID=A0A1G5BVU0_9GAMM|nr:c-type cytochrome [Thiohalorhabdus denitrificans]SCX94315.1 Cytochrome c [Thiohalorhabdus denitrificans]
MDRTRKVRNQSGLVGAGLLAAFLMTGPAAAEDNLDAQVELEQAPAAGEEGYHQPPAIADIPDDQFGEAVRRGMKAFNNTLEYAGEYVGNGQNCSNCHVGNGTVANSAPLWGAWPVYPKYRGKNDHVNTMDERIRGCFTYSMNAGDSEAGGPPEPDSQVLKDMQAYMFWQAQGAPVGENLPGRGYKDVPMPEDGYSVERGEQVYDAQCAICHGADGQGEFSESGEQIFPALWGPKAYNWGAGMHRVNTAAAFIKYNMPLGKADPSKLEGALSDQEAWDVAAYINSHERPQDPRFEGTITDTEEAWHQHECIYGHEVNGAELGQGA